MKVPNKKLKLLIALCAFNLASSLPVQAAEAGNAKAEGCELHVWPTANYGGIFFHASPRYGGYDLVSSPVDIAAQKASVGLDAEQQTKILKDSIEASGKFTGYRIVAHDPLPDEEAKKFSNLLDEPVGAGGRQSPSAASCYAELHVAFITAFRTNLSKMLMTGFVVRYFPSDPAGNAVRVIHSKPRRGEERKGFSNFYFSRSTLTSEERTDLQGTFKFMADGFLRKKVTN